MKKFIKMLSMLMIIAMAFSCVGITSNAEVIDYKKYDNFVYRAGIYGLEITNYKGTAKKIVVPEEIPDSEYNINTVTEVSMKKCEGVNSITIPKTVRSLKLSKMADLKEVKIAEDNEYFVVKNNVVYGKNGKWLRTVPGGLKTVKTATSTEKIMYSSFSGAKIEAVTVTKNVKIIGVGAFSNCKKLKKITINNEKRAPKICESAFSGTKEGIKFYVKNKKVAKQLKNRIKSKLDKHGSRVSKGVKNAKIYVGKTLIYKGIK